MSSLRYTVGGEWVYEYYNFSIKYIGKNGFRRYRFILVLITSWSWNCRTAIRVSLVNGNDCMCVYDISAIDVVGNFVI